MAVDAEYDKYIVIVMLNNYGDVLKVSRTRGITQPLPKLRKYIADSEISIIDGANMMAASERFTPKFFTVFT